MNITISLTQLTQLTQLITRTILILFTFLTQTLNAQWYWQQPIPTGNQFYCVKMVNSQTGYAAGVLGTIVKTTNGGVNWTLLNSRTETPLKGIDFIDANTGAAVGDSCIVVRTTDGGASWTRTRLVTQTGYTYFGGIDFIGNKTGYIAGGKDLSAQNYLFKTTNSGVTWIQLSSGVSNNLYCVSFVDTLNGIMGGARCVLQTTNGGMNWTLNTLGLGGFSNITSASFTDLQNAVVMLEADDVFRTTNGGQNWTQHNLDLSSATGCCDIARGMSMANVSTGFLVSDYGSILKTTNGGVNWQFNTNYLRPNGGFIYWMYGVNSLDSNNAVVVGNGGKILRTANSGSNWAIQNGFKKHLNSNYFTDANTGYVVGDSGKIMKTTNGGDSWTLQQSGTVNRLNTIYFTSPNTGYIGGDTGVILKTTNAGVNWFFQVSGLVGQYINLNDIHFLNSNTGIIAVDSSKILKTTNAGNIWSIKVLPSFGGDFVEGVWILNSTIGIACSTDGIYRSTDGCETWVLLPQGVGGIGKEIFFSDSINGICIASVTYNYVTTNGGANWIRYLNPGTGAALFSVYSFDTLSYGCGTDGYIVKSTNGGINWTRLQRITDNYLNSVFFVNISTGYICGDFGSLLKTTNGGMTFIEKTISVSPENISLSQNYPNPFNPITNIKYYIPSNVRRQTSEVRLMLYNALGKEIYTIVNQKQSAGNYSVELNGSNLPSGIYFYSLYVNENLIDTRKCLLIK